jgi:chromosome segregation ATPase
MKTRSHLIISDGFDKNVAEKMPKIREEDESPPTEPVTEFQPIPEGPSETVSSEAGVEREFVLPPPLEEERGAEKSEEVLNLIDDLHNQLLVSSRTRRTLEVDLASLQRDIHQRTRENEGLRRQLEDQKKEIQRLKEVQAESIYLKDENADAVEKLQELHQELREVKEGLAKITQERDEALHYVRQLEAQKEQDELLRVKGRLKEKEISHLSKENQELQSRLKEAFAQNLEIEKKYETVKKSFDEVRESLTLLRDSVKKDYYHLSDSSE